LKILLLGRNGQVGWELERTLAPLGELTALGRAELDLADVPRLVARVRALQPEAIVNAAAYTAVDKAESEREAAFAINATAPRVLAEEARRIGALLVHYSTDYVFDGAKAAPYVEDDAPNPLNVYGASKLAGERAIAAAGCRHLILRTSWVYSHRGSNFLLTILRKARESGQLRVVADQVGAPTPASMLARATATALERVRRAPALQGGLYHVTPKGRTTWHGFAEAIVSAAGVRATVEPITSNDYPSAATRPRFSVLDSSRFTQSFRFAFPEWRSALEEVLRRMPPL
jgi:dTDP-4-dehydrorhamnose reductase